MKHLFKASIYKDGINACVDVPLEITSTMKSVKGYIRIKGQINNFHFEKSLVALKDKPYKLFVNLTMLKGGNTGVGEVAFFKVEQDKSEEIKEYPVPDLLVELLNKHNLTEDFNALTAARKQHILKYLSSLKTDEALKTNSYKLITQLKNKEKFVRLP